MLKPPVSEKDQSTGNKNSGIVLAEFGDYQCPHCGHAHPLVKQLLEEQGDNFRFVFRNFPLQEAHPDAFMAAVAAEAAGKQAQFWPMHDMIFENQDDLSETALVGFAEQLGFDMKQFDRDLNNEPIKEKIESDFESGIRSGVNGTPTFFLNGQRVDYDGNYESLLNAITEANG